MAPSFNGWTGALYQPLPSFLPVGIHPALRWPPPVYRRLTLHNKGTRLTTGRRVALSEPVDSQPRGNARGTGRDRQ